MVQRTLPGTTTSNRVDADWQPVGLVSGPEGVLYGGGVTYLGARVVRLLPLKGKFGGFFWGTDQPVDVESQVNTSGNDRVDRLVMVYESGIGNRPFVLPGVASADPVAPGVTQNLITEGNGLWQVPLAHWTVGRNGGPISNLVYESGFPVRQIVRKSGESGAGVGGGGVVASLQIDSMSITPYHGRAEIECETVVFIETLNACGGAVTINAGGVAETQPFGSTGPHPGMPVPITHKFTVETFEKVDLNLVVSTERDSTAVTVRRVSHRIRERAI